MIFSLFSLKFCGPTVTDRPATLFLFPIDCFLFVCVGVCVGVGVCVCEGIVSVSDVEVAVGQTALLHCDVGPASTDDAVLVVLWYLEPQRNPIFS